MTNLPISPIATPSVLAITVWVELDRVLIRAEFPAVEYVEDLIALGVTGCPVMN